MTIYTDNRLLQVGLIGGTLSRHWGNMREMTAQNSAYQRLDIPPEKILHFHQVHSDTIISVHTSDEAQRIQRDPLHQADAWLLTTSGWGAAILTADCVPLFLWDEQARVFALAHCGWRGVVKRLPFLTAQAIRKTPGTEKILGWLGPHIQVCCFEVKEDVASQFSPDSLHYEKGKIFVNLNLEILHQLQEAGLSRTDIKTPYYCTCGDKENFFSWRRDHKKDSLLSFIYKP